MSYDWPGNVRELRNVIERAVLLGEGNDARQPPTSTACTAARVTNRGDGGFTLPPGGVKLDDVERSLVVQALERADGVQTRAAALLGLHRDQIRYRIEKFGLKGVTDAVARRARGLGRCASSHGDVRACDRVLAEPRPRAARWLSARLAAVERRSGEGRHHRRRRGSRSLQSAVSAE